MILYYAMGGGLGHLTRARRVLAALGLEDRATVLTSSGHAADERVLGGVPVLRVPASLARRPRSYRRMLRGILRDHEELYVDAFPGGILGELCDLPEVQGLRVHHVARRLRQAYGRRLRREPPRFDRTHAVEELPPWQRSWLARRSGALDSLSLPPLPAGPGHWAAGRRREAGSLWLVVHAGPPAEVAELLRRAERARLREDPGAALALAARTPPAGLDPRVEVLDVYPATGLYPHCDRIWTAAGFNSMDELRPYRSRHRFIPFARPLDDQEGRADISSRIYCEPMDTAEAIRSARQAAGLTQVELARRSGTSQATISAYEHGTKTPTPETFGRVLAAAGRRLTTVPAARPVRVPTEAELARRGRVLSEVVDLAERLPARHARTLRYPRLA